MKKTGYKIFIGITIGLGVILTGCASNNSQHSSNGQPMYAMDSSPIQSARLMGNQPELAKASSEVSEQSRQLIKRSWLTIGVKDLSQAGAQAKAIVEKQLGYINSSNDTQGESLNLSIRVPQDQYTSTLAQLRQMGEVISDNENVQDVTAEFIDNKARLENLYKLRDRIQLLLNRADRIDDILKIERELNRTQSEIDRLEGRMKYLKGQVDYATIELTAEKQKIYGPLGYFFMGIWWGVEKMFIWDQ